MDIGIPRETRSGEHRVALTPSGVKALAQHGHRVWVETGAGTWAGHPDAEYQAEGATVVFSRLEPFARAELVASVFPPAPADYGLLQREQTVFAFWTLPTARPEDLRALLGRGITAVGLEAIEDDLGHAPVLTSMSEIAGSMAVTVAASLLLTDLGGKGIVLGGAPGVPPASFVILGAGVAGRSAARSALGLSAAVTLLDEDVAPLRDVAQAFRGVGDDAGHPSQRREGAFLRRRRPRRGSAPRRAVAGSGDAGDAPRDAPAQRGRGPRHRHGRMLRDLPPDRFPEPDLRGGRRPAEGCSANPAPLPCIGAGSRRWSADLRPFPSDGVHGALFATRRGHGGIV